MHTKFVVVLFNIQNFGRRYVHSHNDVTGVAVVMPFHTPSTKGNVSKAMKAMTMMTMYFLCLIYNEDVTLNNPIQMMCRRHILPH